MKYTVEFQYENNVAVVRFENNSNFVSSLDDLTKESLKEFIKTSYQQILDEEEKKREKQMEIERRKELAKSLEMDIAEKEFEINENKEIKEVRKVKVVLEPV